MADSHIFTLVMMFFFSNAILFVDASNNNLPKVPESNAKNVIIIGMGLAGSELLTLMVRDNVQNVVAFEALNTYGGRVKGVKVGDYNVPAGAGWQQGGGEHHELTYRLEKCNITVQAQNWDRWIDYDADGQPNWGDWAGWETAFACAEQLAIYLTENNLPDISQDTALRLCGWSARNQLDDLVQVSTIDFEWAEPAKVTSLKASLPWATYDFPHTDEDNFIIDARGAEELVGCWLDRFMPATGGRRSSLIKYNSPVKKVYVNEKIVELQNGEAYSYNYLFDTRSVGVHQWDLVHNAGKAFEPPLPPAVQKGIISYHMSFYMKVFFQFPLDIWNEYGSKQNWKTQFHNIVSPDGLSGVLWQDLDVKGFLPGSNITFFTITSPESDRLGHLDDAHIIKAAMRSIRVVLGEGAPEPIHAYVSRWSTNPFFRGSYSNIPVEASSDDTFESIFQPFGPNHSIVLTGEAYCKRLSGYMHSALLSAQTSYDEWKLRTGSLPVMRERPRDTMCFTNNPTLTYINHPSSANFTTASSTKRALNRDNEGRQRRRNLSQHRVRRLKKLKKAQESPSKYTHYSDEAFNQIVKTKYNRAKQQLLKKA